MSDSIERMPKVITDKETLERLKKFFEWIIEQMSDHSEVDSFDVEAKADELKLIKRVDAPEDDEFDYYIFPLWYGEQAIRNQMGIEWDQPTPKEKS